MDKAVERQSTAMELLENMFDVEMRFLQSGSGNIEMLTSAFHRDVVVHEPHSLPYAGDWNGLEGIPLFSRRCTKAGAVLRWRTFRRRKPMTLSS